MAGDGVAGSVTGDGRTGGSATVAGDRTSAGDGRARLDARFAKLWTASTTSALGSGLTTIAAPLLVASRTSDPLIVSAAAAVAWLPWLLFALPGGVLVDRVDRRQLMIIIDVVRVGAMGALATAIATGRVSIALLYTVLFLVNAGEVVFRAASQAMIPAVVPRAALERANGWLVGGTTLMQGMVAGPLGGFLFVVAASIPFFANAGTYAASALLLGLIAGRYGVSPAATGAAVPRAGGEPQAGEPQAGGELRPAGSVWAEAAQGLRWLMRQRLLRTMALLIGLLNVTLTAALAVLVLLAKQRLHLGSVGFGLLFTCLALGGILGSVIGDRLIRWVTATWTVRIGLLVEAGTHLTLAASRSAYLVGFVMLVFGVHGALWSIVANSLRQRLTPPDMLGRVGSANLFIAAGGNSLGALLGGAVATRFGLTAPYWIGFVVAIGVSAATWRVFNRATVSRAYADAGSAGAEPEPATAATG